MPLCVAKFLKTLRSLRMLLPDNVHPESTIYYNGYLILRVLKRNKTQSLIDLFVEIKQEHGISFMLFILCLDWLYLIDAAKMNTTGMVELCL